MGGGGGTLAPKGYILGLGDGTIRFQWDFAFYIRARENVGNLHGPLLFKW